MSICLICLFFLLLSALSCRGQLRTGASALQLSAWRSRNTNTAHARGPGAAPRTQLGGRLSVSQAHPVHLRCPHLSWLSRFTQSEMIYRCYGSKSAPRAPRGWWSISSPLAGDEKDKHRMETSTIIIIIVVIIFCQWGINCSNGDWVSDVWLF